MILLRFSLKTIMTMAATYILSTSLATDLRVSQGVLDLAYCATPTAYICGGFFRAVQS